MRGKSISQHLRIAPDQESMGNTGEVGGQCGNASLLRNAACNPDQPVITAKGTGGGIGIGGLAVIHKSNAVACGHQALAWRQAGI